MSRILTNVTLRWLRMKTPVVKIKYMFYLILVYNSSLFIAHQITATMTCLDRKKFENVKLIIQFSQR